MDTAKSLVDVPDNIKQQKKYTTFISALRPEIEILPMDKRKELVFDLVLYVASLAELYWFGSKKGDVKKRAVLELLNGIEPNNNLEKMLELALRSGQVATKTIYKRIKRFFKKALVLITKK